MDFDQLRHFLRVAERASFTRAAEEMGVSQPTLSRSIQRLEQGLGQPVFERRTRSVALTDAGKLLRGRAQQVLTILEDTRAEISDNGRTGRLRIGAIPTVAPYFLPDLLREFAEAYPEAQLVVQEEATDRLLRRCAEGETDLAILALPISAKHIEVEELLEEELMLVLPNGHPLADKKRIKLSDVQPLPFVLLDEAHCLSDNIVSFCRGRSFQPVAVEHTSQLTMVQELVSLSHGVSMIPAMARAVDQSDRRVYRTLSGAKPSRKIVMAWNPYRFQSKLLEAFKERLRAYAARR